MANHTVQLTEAQRAWVDALRSDKYQQGTGRLTEIGKGGELKNCCLGVGCRIAIEHGVAVTAHEARENILVPRIEYDDEAYCLPDSVREWLGLKDEWGTFSGGVLYGLNDNDGATFAEIADVIEEHAEELFVEASS